MRFGICNDPSEFGLESLYGLWFARGNMLRDFASLNKVETVPYLIRLARGYDWKEWRLEGTDDSTLTEDDLSLLDKAAKLSLDPDNNFKEIRVLYDGNLELQPPANNLKQGYRLLATRDLK